jgi:hypothetical protein
MCEDCTKDEQICYTVILYANLFGIIYQGKEENSVATVIVYENYSKKNLRSDCSVDCSS